MGRHALPPPEPELLVASGAVSETGGVRDLNEDALLAESPVFLVADGMGGHRGGDIASALALEPFTDLLGRPFVTAEEVLERVARAANAVSSLGHDSTAPGTTLTGVLLSLQGDLPCLRVVNIGDSRTYHFGAGTFSQVTRDHSEVQELLDTGRLTEEQARLSQRRNVITRALGAGAGPHVAADHYLLPAHAGDRYVICSDGLSSQVTDALIEMVVRSIKEPTHVAVELARRANAAGGRDNVTVVVVDILSVNPHWGDLDLDESTVPSRPAARAADEDTLPRPVSLLEERL